MLIGLIAFLSGLYQLWCSTLKGSDIGLSGYRTLQSEASPKNWKVSNLMAGILLIIEGIIIFIIALVRQWGFWNWASFGLFSGLVIFDIIIIEVFLYFYTKKQGLKKRKFKINE